MTDINKLKLLKKSKGVRMSKKYNIITAIITVVIILFTGCSSNQINVNINQNSEEYIANEDFQNYIDSFSSFIKVDGGYYFITDLKLYFYDTEKKESYLVCSKTNCKHQNSDCLAYLSPFQFYHGMSVRYYDNNIYILGYEQEKTVKHNYIFQFSLNNFKRKKAAYLFDSSGQISTLFIVHRGYVYYVNCTYEMKENTVSIFRVKLGEIEKNAPQKIFEFSGIGTNIFGLSAYGNKLFFMTSSYEDEAGNGYNSILNYMDIHTLETNQIPERKYSHTADSGKVYYGKDEKTVECYDLKTKETTFFCNINGPCYISADSNYIYFDNRQKMHIEENFNDRKIYVYDKSGNYITEIVPKNPEDDCYFGGDDVMIFKEITVTGEVVESEGAKGYYVLDKSQITSPDKQFIDME